MILDAQLEQMTAADMAGVVRRVLNDERAQPLSWAFRPMVWVMMNPSTVGLYQVSGVAENGAGRTVPWEVVLKVLGDPPHSGGPFDVGCVHEPQDWSYWKREAQAFGSGLLSDLPGPFVAVRCFEVTSAADGMQWLWLEALNGAEAKAPLTPEQLTDMAYDLGAFAAQWAEKRAQLDEQPWLAQHWLRSIATFARTFGVDHAATHAGCWNNPLLTSVGIPPSTQDRVAALVHATDDLLDLHESLPTTLAHHDAHADNLFWDRSARGRRTVAIDWGFAGRAPVGADLGVHIACNILRGAVDPLVAREFDRSSTAAYLQGLRDFGWRGDEEAVLFARATSAALEITISTNGDVAQLCDDFEAPDLAWPHARARARGMSVEEVMRRWSARFLHTLDMGDEARHLAGRLTHR